MVVLILQNVSEDFLNELNKTIRNRTYVEISLGVANNQLTSENTTTDNGKVYYSGNTYFEQSNENEKTEYATLEKDYFLLDGSKTNLPDSEYDVQPIILNNLTDENGNFVNEKPTITITATDQDETYSLIGLTMKFDVLENDYPTNFTIERYLGDTLIGTYNCTNDKAIFLSDFSLEDFNKLKIIFNSMNKPYRRVRIFNIILGLEIVYTEDDVITMTHKKETDVLSREIMQNSFEFTVDNYNGQYNADNPTTLNKFLQDFQKISVKYFQEMDNGTNEVVSGGNYYLSGTPKVDKSQVTFYATGIMEQLTDKYYRAYENNGNNYKAILLDIFAQKVMPNNLGSINCEIDNSLENMICDVPIPANSAKEVVQLICNATNMVCYEDVNAVIHIVPNNTVAVNYKIGLDEQYEFPIVSTLGKLKNIKVKYYSKSVATSKSEIFSETYDNLEIGVPTEINIDYSNPCKDGVAIVTGATVNSATYYAYGCLINITPTSTSATVKINGYDIDMNTGVAILKVNENGEDCEIDNPLITTREQALAVAENFKTYLLYRNTYSLTTRGNLALDINDIVKLQTQFSEEIQGLITSSKLTYDGSVKSDLEIKGLINS